LFSAASDVDPDHVAGQRAAEIVATVGDAALQTRERPAAATAATSAEEQPAPASATASTPTRNEEAARTPPPRNVVEEESRAPTPPPAKERGVPTPPRAGASSTVGSPGLDQGPMMPATTAGGSTANEETRAASNDDVEEIQGRPRDGRQHVYVWRQRRDHFIGHEELAETEEAARVERAVKRLVDEVKVSGPLCCSILMCCVPRFDMCSCLQGTMNTAKYRKRCFDQIEGIVAENKALSAEVDRLRSEAEDKVAEMSYNTPKILILDCY